MDNCDYFAGYEKPVVQLDDWSMVPSAEMNPYMAPEHPARRPLLYGRVTGHPRYENGTYVTTSCILASAGREVETNNTIYNLGLMSDGYREWCSSNGIDVSSKHPVKMENV